MAVPIGLALGALIGVLLGLLGGGGSILAVPALVYGLGLSIGEAIPISLIVVAAASAVGALPKIRAGQVQWRMAGIFAAAGIPATVAGSAVSKHLPEPVLMIGFAVVMVVAGIRMLTDQGHTGTACEVRGGRVDWRRCAPRSIGAGLLVGVLTGLFGVGGGFLIIPALVVVLGVEMSTAIGTSLLIIVANSLAGLVSHLDAVGGDWGITAAFVGAAMATSLVAGHFGTKVDTDRLQRWFAYLVFVVAAYVLVDTIIFR
ncbi:sulfite exporter TauE/SafE family protein [Mycolicibacterium austroafricanum]|uniref:Probable membrane transporter protein n=1 Tax=Mycolicibacterium austroafricanum TaxID=39687 RepID=A0ABT8HR41_MYCAO|nr:sulfite exporter TauE/SafE family protein [Mycolicibacterium austroafricanum]MDN4522767.1 sulfite exporter TauE/SafE family protein [Mycolicibacterium austroafricanum]QRZ06885.1 sulfite exporter TauE/SafE family protein [Mycolicibacterium austroafricanum]QZT62782.1 sulfite exporter TauE/SafE family protein [Mycolicibacterium austroafricanum]QZT68367.1 sulfite exporter TauE/SafE family protein [Mycolicibacterium austroafricanum]